MAIPDAYVRTPAKFKELLGKLPSAGVPERVTYEFLKTLDFKSSGDRAMIAVLKAIGFLDSEGAPTATYKAFRNPTEGPRILANALREAYGDLFLANTNAHQLSIGELKGIIATKVTKGEKVVEDIARTFRAMAEIGDFTQAEHAEKKSEVPAKDAPPRPEQSDVLAAARAAHPSFHYNIEIHLPTTTDIAVYNAIFKSLRENLL